MTTLRREHFLKPALAARRSPINTGFPTVGISVNSLVTLYALPTTQRIVGGLNTTVAPLFKSTDAAPTWTAASNNLPLASASWGALNTRLSPSAYITAIVLAPSDSSTIYILAPAFNPSMPTGLLQVGGLVRSRDAGQTWTLP